MSHSDLELLKTKFPANLIELNAYLLSLVVVKSVDVGLYLYQATVEFELQIHKTHRTVFKFRNYNARLIYNNLSDTIYTEN